MNQPTSGTATVAKSTDERQHRLIVEFELPETFADDLPALIEEYGDSFGSPGELILNEIGQMSHGVLTFEFCGENAGSVLTVPVLAVGARVEHVPPTVISDDLLAAFAELDPRVKG